MDKVLIVLMAKWAAAGLFLPPQVEVRVKGVMDDVEGKLEDMRQKHSEGF